MQAVILAGGEGMRLYPLNSSVAKPMLSLFDRPVMEHTIRLLARHGIDDIIVTISGNSRDILEFFGDGSRCGVKIRYSIEKEPLGTAGAIKILQDRIKDTFVVISGDIITDMDFTSAIEAHRESSSIATIMLAQSDDPMSYGVVDCDESGRVTRFLEKPKYEEEISKNINTGIYILEPEVLSCIPYNSVYDFARNLFPRMLNNSEPICGTPIQGYWCDAGDMLNYRLAHFDALCGRLKLKIPGIHIGSGIWVGENVRIDPSAHLCAPAYIGSGSVIGPNAVIGEQSIIGAGTLVEEGASISHSVIGGGVQINASTSVTNMTIAGGCSIWVDDDVTVAGALPLHPARSRVAP